MFEQFRVLDTYWQWGKIIHRNSDFREQAGEKWKKFKGGVHDHTPNTDNVPLTAIVSLSFLLLHTIYRKKHQ